jgi:hypothetical protein
VFYKNSGTKQGARKKRMSAFPTKGRHYIWYSTTHKVNDKDVVSVLKHYMMMYEGVEVKLFTFLTFVLDGGEGSAPWPLTPEERSPDTFLTASWVDPKHTCFILNIYCLTIICYLSLLHRLVMLLLNSERF